MSQEKRGCGAILASLFGKSTSASATQAPEDLPSLPYKVRDRFLSAAEISFYHVLKLAVDDKATICPKVRLLDVFYVSQPHINKAYRNKIDRKHVDFLLCEPKTMKPLIAIELDDKSHRRADRVERDKFVDAVFEDAGLKLIRVRAQRTYNINDVSMLLKEHLVMLFSSR